MPIFQRKFNLYFCFLMCFSYFSYSQGEANNWYFGQNAGISFNTNPPSILFDGQLSTLEGCSSISSPNGDLLFYTDGQTIWNANHQIMPNANYLVGTGLKGDPSSTSSGLIVPHPTEDDIYFVFAVDEPHHNNAFAYPNQGPADQFGNSIPDYNDPGTQTVPQDDDGFNNGLSYSVVDMSLNGGLGDVVPFQKNIELITYDPNNSEDVKYKCSEKITAVRGRDCNSVWLITHFKDTFYAFKIDENGLNETPVTSQTGPFVSTNDYRRAAIGYLKASPNGDKLLIANQTLDFNPITLNDDGTGNIFLFDFDNETGIVSNPLELLSNVNAYSVEFSAEATMAYASVSIGSQPQLYQWDLESENINASVYLFPNVGGNGSGAIQLAPNGKIYRSMLGESKLSVINNPDLPGAQADYSESFANGAINLGNRNASFGLPPFIQSLFSTKIDITGQGPTFTNVEICDGDTYELFYDEIENAEYIWFRNDVEIQNENSSSLTIQQEDNADLPLTDVYRLEANLNDGSCPLIGVANVTFFPRPDVFSGFLNECVTDFEQNAAVFDLTEANEQLFEENVNLSDYNFYYFENIEDAANFENEINNPSAYTNTSSPQILGVVVQNSATGCESIVELTLDVLAVNTQVFSLSRCDDNQNGVVEFDLTEIESHEGIAVSNFYLTENDALNQTNAIQNPESFQNDTPYFQNVFFNIESNSVCKEQGDLSLEIIELPLTEDDTVFYCVEQSPNLINISVNIPEEDIDDFSFLWLETNETTPEILINSPGSYEVAISNTDTGCTNFRTVEVSNSSLANYQLDIEEFFEDRNRVSVILSENSIGSYEYALNADGPYQDSNFFENLLPGIYNMFVRDKNGCGVTQKTFGILGIMEFFTPNGDGINDIWQFRGVFNNKEALAQVFIFDRYGKLIKSLRGLDKFWDGTYNGKPMPPQDYWYRIELESGRVLAGSFTLKR